MEKTKFNVNKDTAKRTYNDITFDSVLEMRYYRDVLLPAVEKGDVVYYELQKKYELQPQFKHDGKNVNPINYVADFYIECKNGSIVVIDTKGCPDTSAIIKRKLFWYKYPEIDYRWVSYSKMDGGWVDYDYLKACRAERKRAKKERIRKEDK